MKSNMLGMLPACELAKLRSMMPAISSESEENMVREMICSVSRIITE